MIFITNVTKKNWPNVKVQLCLWHIKKALKKKLADNTPPKIITYSSSSANENFPFIDIEFYPLANEKKSNFIFVQKIYAIVLSHYLKNTFTFIL